MTEFYSAGFRAGYDAAKDECADEIERLREALQKARNTLSGLGFPKIASDICDPALKEKK